MLLDETLLSLDAASIGNSASAQIVAIGLGDTAPVVSGIALAGITLRPLVPVHPRSLTGADGSRSLAWTRRARGAWSWSDGVDTPLHEQAEAYQVGFGPADAPIAVWEVSQPGLNVPAATLASLLATLPGGTFYVRQRGSYALSAPLLLANPS